MLTDPIADMLTRIRNANKAMHDTAEMPSSRMKEGIARLLKEEGYIKDYRVVEGTPYPTLVVELKFGKNRQRVITDLRNQLTAHMQTLDLAFFNRQRAGQIVSRVTADVR